MSLGLQPDTLLYSTAGSSWILPCAQQNLSYFHVRLICFSTCSTRETTWNFLLLIKCCTGRFKFRQDDGELSIIPCFYIPVLLPVQSSMHGWTGLTGRSHPGRQGTPGRAGWGDPANLRASQSSCIHPRVPHHCTSQKQIALRIYRQRAEHS